MSTKCIGPEVAGIGTTFVAAEDINASTGNAALNGAMIAIDSTSGLAYKATNSATRRVAGVTFDKVLTGATGYAKKSVYRLNNSTTSPLTQADAGEVCYVEDSITVASAGNSVAGTIMEVDGLGVMVWVGVKAAVV